MLAPRSASDERRGRFAREAMLCVSTGLLEGPKAYGARGRIDGCLCMQAHGFHGQVATTRFCEGV